MAGITPLLFNIFKGKEQVVHEMLQEYKELGSEKSRIDINAPDQHGSSPLHMACYRGNLRITKMLSEAGADMTAVDVNGNSLLHIAAGSGAVELAEYLIQQGARINTNKEGETPLDVCKKICPPGRKMAMLSVLGEAEEGMATPIGRSHMTIPAGGLQNRINSPANVLVPPPPPPTRQSTREGVGPDPAAVAKALLERDGEAVLRGLYKDIETAKFTLEGGMSASSLKDGGASNDKDSENSAGRTDGHVQVDDIGGLLTTVLSSLQYIAVAVDNQNSKLDDLSQKAARTEALLGSVSDRLTRIEKHLSCQSTAPASSVDGK